MEAMIIINLLVLIKRKEVNVTVTTKKPVKVMEMNVSGLLKEEDFLVLLMKSLGQR